MRDYTGQTVFLGIDVHRKSYFVTAICNGAVVKRDTINACPDIVVKYCRRHFPAAKIISAYEAGFSGLNLHRRLTSNGIKNLVVHPASIEVAVNNRAKTDKKDSLKIAQLLSLGRLQGNYIPSEQEEAKRAITRLRTDLMRERTRVGGKIKSLLYYYGLIDDKTTKKISSRWLSEVLELKMAEEVKYSLDTYVTLWKHLAVAIEDAKRQSAKILSNSETEAIYLSAPGIGPITAHTLMAEVGDMSRFSSDRKLFSFLGLTPREYSSGEHTRRGHITKQGRPSLRGLLVESAWTAIRIDGYLEGVYNELKVRSGCKKAVVAVARRLAGRLRACLRDKVTYKCGGCISSVVKKAC